MAEYIDLDEKIVVFDTRGTERETTVRHILEMNKCSYTAADVRPVVRGRWIEDWETGCSECSACHDTFLWEDYKGVAEWNFCPNCGAMMEEC